MNACAAWERSAPRRWTSWIRPLELHLAHGERGELAPGDLGLRRAPGHERDADAVGHESLDGLQGRKLHDDVEPGPVPREGADRAVAVRGPDVVGEEGLGAELPDGHLRAPRQPVPPGDEERQPVGREGDDGEAGIGGAIGEDADLRVAAHHLLGDPARERATHLDADEREAPVVLGEDRQDVGDGVLVRRDGDLALAEVAELPDGRLGVPAQVEHLVREASDDLAGRGQRAVLRRSVHERRADLLLEPAHRLAHRRLGAVEAGRRAGEPVLLRHRDEHLEVREIQGRLPSSRILMELLL